MSESQQTKTTAMANGHRVTKKHNEEMERLFLSDIYVGLAVS
jgi:hypothetical protein